MSYILHTNNTNHTNITTTNMNTKSKKTNTKKKDLTDTTLIRLRKSTLAMLKNIKADKYRDEEVTYSYDKLIRFSLTETFKVN